jgi:hypothetical protein
MHLPGLAGAISSPPYSETRIGQESGQEHCGHGDQYGETDAQLGAMKATEEGFRGAVSSPPYVSGGHHPDQTGAYNTNGRGQGQTKDTAGYGGEPGQLGQMPEGDFDGAVSSPPFECQSGGTNVTAKTGVLADKRLLTRHAAGNAAAGYGDTDGNLGSEQGDEFWTAARQIVEQVYLALTPGKACWVVKDFVKNKARAPFCDQWRQLCEAVGFVTLHEHHAMLVHRVEHDFDGKEKRGESKSFFRRLAENKGSPRIDYEIVFCMEKPG